MTFKMHPSLSLNRFYLILMSKIQIKHKKAAETNTRLTNVGRFYCRAVDSEDEKQT